MKKRKVNIILRDGGQIPVYKTRNSAGADLFSSETNEVIVLPPNGRALIHTGISLELPEDAEAQVRARSGLSLKKGLVAILGTIDSDYQGEIGILIHNISDKICYINPGERYAQIVFNGDGGLFQAEFNEVDSFSRDSERGEGGFGHIGTK